jgi:DNA primase
MLVPSKEFRNSLETATSQFQKNLNSPDGERGRQFLMDRGITSQAMEYFRLGYVATPRPEFERFYGMVSIPYLTRGGVVSIRFRNIPDAEGTIRGAKYMSLSGVAGMVRPFNPSAIYRPETYIFLCEGEFDTIVATMCGLPAVGFPGAKAWKREYAGLFRYRTTYVLADNDDKGDGRSFAEAIAGDHHDTKIIMMPHGHDVNSFFCANGRDALLELIGFSN